ncbi:MAG: GNAT family N-acetyltransferase [Clostridia bacterium]|nr:GNAT family N-acetyltransferase [Clostridia bacterium]
MKTIETERLVLRAWTMEDAPALFDYAKNPLVGPSAGWNPHKSIEESEEYLRFAIEQDETWAVTCKPDNRALGAVGLHATGVDTTRELGYVLHPDFWGKGIMTEAAKAVIRFGFTELKLDSIRVVHNVINHRSKHVIQKCGFRYDGTLRRNTRRVDGSLSDDCTYSMTREEWEAGPKESRFYSFVQNRACEYFPCHKTNDPEHFNCLFCYCPLYRMKDCGGNPAWLENGMKDCSGCTVPHFHYEHVISKLSERERT